MNIGRIIASLSELYPQQPVPLHQTHFSESDANYLRHILLKGDLATPGAESKNFEGRIQQMIGAPAVVLNSGTSALSLALRLVGVKSGEEVITQALTFVATPNAIVHVGAEPVFIDVDEETMGLSASALRNFLENYVERRADGVFNSISGKRIAAVLPMHTFGFMCDMDALRSLCTEYQLPLVEDAAEAYGSQYKGDYSGTLGEVGIYSFNGNKILTTGGGGALVSRNESLIERAKSLSTTAKLDHPYDYFHTDVAYNTRMPAWNAALGNLQMERLAATIEAKKIRYQGMLESAQAWGLNVIQPPVDTQWNYWLTAVETESTTDKQALVEALNQQGYNARPIWNLMHTLPMYQHCYRDAMGNSERLFSKVVCLPSSPR